MDMRHASDPSQTRTFRQDTDLEKITEETFEELVEEAKKMITKKIHRGMPQIEQCPKDCPHWKRGQIGVLSFLSWMRQMPVYRPHPKLAEIYVEEEIALALQGRPKKEKDDEGEKKK